MQGQHRPRRRQAGEFQGANRRFTRHMDNLRSRQHRVNTVAHENRQLSVVPQHAAGQRYPRLLQAQLLCDRMAILREKRGRLQHQPGIPLEHVRRQRRHGILAGALDPIDKFIRRIQTQPPERPSETQADTTVAIILADRRSQSCHGDPVAAPVVAQQMTPAARPRHLRPVPAVHARARAADDDNARIVRTEGRRKSRIGVATHIRRDSGPDLFRERTGPEMVGRRATASQAQGQRRGTRRETPFDLTESMENGGVR